MTTWAWRTRSAASGGNTPIRRSLLADWAITRGGRPIAAEKRNELPPLHSITSSALVRRCTGDHRRPPVWP